MTFVDAVPRLLSTWECTVTHPSIVVENEMKHCLKSHLKRTTRRKLKTMLSKNRTENLSENSTLTNQNFKIPLENLCEFSSGISSPRSKFGACQNNTIFENSRKIRSTFVSFEILLFFATFRRISMKFALITFAQYCM